MQKFFPIGIISFALLLIPGALTAQDASSTAALPPQAAPVAPATKSADLDKAEAAMSKSDWKSAEPLLDTWLAARTTDSRALFDAAYVADAQSRSDDATALYRRALEADPRNFDAQVSLGLLLARTGHPDLAKPELEKATALDPGEARAPAKARAWRALAQIQATLPAVGGKPDTASASQDLIEALKISPETPQDTILAAQLAELAGDPATTEAAWRRVLKFSPGNTEAIAGITHLLIAQKKYTDAEALLRPALAKSPDDPAFTAQLAAVLVAQDKADALPLLQGFHQKHPDNTTITQMLAQVLADAGEYADSDKLYQAQLATNPTDTALLIGHGHNLIRLQRPAEALQVFQKAAEIDPASGEAWNGVAFAAFQTHQPSITIHALTQRSKFLPENATIDFLWATAYDTLHQKKEAAAYYHRFLDSAGGKFPDQEWQARQRLTLLDKAP